MSKVNCILLVDDNPADNVFHKIQIQKTGLCQHIKIAVDGEQALEYIRKANSGNDPENYPFPNIIFLDINMPRMNGFEFLEESKREEYKLHSALIFVMLTTSLNPDDKERSKAYSEVKEFHCKPLTSTMVMEIVGRYFKQHD